ncbi:MAG: hydantoinase B/oxoprolinase family protein, partial [Pseudomonadota bacterium]|nr:hydantoinase B/oxoprolinase family protein [Pseudomonadota bacterium]
AILDEIAAEARAQVQGQNVPADAIEVNRVAHVRASGAHLTIEVPFGSAQAMTAQFLEQHRARFGYAPEQADLIVELLVVEAVGRTGAIPDIDTAPHDGRTPRTARMFTNGEWRDVPLENRLTLSLGDKVKGPAIIGEPTGTNIVEPGWEAEVIGGGNLVLRRVEAQVRNEAIGTQADPLMLEVFNNLFMNIAEQMGATLANTAYSINIKERLDFSCAIFDAEGSLVANAPHVPVHLGSMSDSVRRVLDQNRGQLRPGDAIMMNDPFNGGTHLPDVTVVTPVFDEAGEDLLFVVASRGHHADIGGTTPGSAPPDSRHIDEEGVLIDNFFLVREGRFQEEDTRALLASGRYPCRNIDQNIADLAAQIAANSTGAHEVARMVAQFGQDVVQAYMVHVQNNAEECVRRVIDVLKDSAYSYSLDNGAKIEVKISIDRGNRSAVVDFAGTSPQQDG